MDMQPRTECHFSEHISKHGVLKQRNAAVVTELLQQHMLRVLWLTETPHSSFRYGDSVLQAFGLAQHGAAVVSVPDQTELWNSEGAGRPCSNFPP